MTRQRMSPRQCVWWWTAKRVCKGVPEAIVPCVPSVGYVWRSLRLNGRNMPLATTIMLDSGRGLIAMRPL